MTKTKTENTRSSVSRREFIKWVAVAGLLAGCRPAHQPDATPGITAGVETPVPTPTLTPQPVAFDPTLPGRVVQASHAGAWADGDLVPDALRQLLDASITKLASLNDAGQAWAALFDPGERVAIKVNGLRNGATHVPLVMAVTECLQDVGVPPEQIVIFDRNTAELVDMGYPVNVDGPGVRCYGNGDDWGLEGSYTAGWTLIDTEIRVSDILLECDALVNMPILKQAMGPGISFGMKNHYGTFDVPWLFHNDRFERAMGELNALPPIRDKTRLTIGDVLTTETASGNDGYRVMGVGNTILMSFDPVAPVSYTHHRAHET